MTAPPNAPTRMNLLDGYRTVYMYDMWSSLSASSHHGNDLLNIVADKGGVLCPGFSYFPKLRLVSEHTYSCETCFAG